jgi:hypothetical protein
MQRIYAVLGRDYHAVMHTYHKGTETYSDPDEQITERYTVITPCLKTATDHMVCVMRS